MSEKLTHADGSELEIPSDVVAASDNRDLILAYVNAQSDAERQAIAQQAAERLAPVAAAAEAKSRALLDGLASIPTAIIPPDPITAARALAARESIQTTSP